MSPEVLTLDDTGFPQGKMMSSLHVRNSDSSGIVFTKARVSAATIFRVIDHKPRIDRNVDLELESGTGLVQLQNVDFYSYPSWTEVRILNDFSLAHLVGSSCGSGKSTVISLIERFYI
ncbi:hypothetical protein K1719_009870 [Acacia pycnantha]|nr:hypothetical protein K1719_009870 [Acacia pycnantha]